MASLPEIKALITRPELSGEDLSLLIRARGGCAWSLPLIAIEPLKDNAMQDIKKYASIFSSLTGIIFISRFAALYGAAVVNEYVRQAGNSLPTCYAIGSGTASVLKKYNIEAGFARESSSEALAELSAFQAVSERNFLIIKGEGGRSYLKDTLESRGACINELCLYRRKKLIYPANKLDETVCRHKINVIVITSGEILENFLDQVKLSLLGRVTLLVPGVRIMAMAKRYGCPYVVCSSGAGHHAVLKSLTELQKQMSN